MLLSINAINGDDREPDVSVGLARDTAPDGTTNQDGITSDATISGRVIDDLTGVSWLSDVESYFASLAPGVPTVLAGISGSGKFVAALAKRNPPDLAGMAMTCPGLFARQQANLVQRSRLRAAGLRGLAVLRIPIPLRDPALFTDTPRWRDYIRDDPLTLRRITIRFALADLKLNGYARAAPEQIRVPALLMLAGRERIVDNPRTADFFRRLSSPDKTQLDYPATGHTLEFKPDPTAYLRDLRDWAARATRK